MHFKHPNILRTLGDLSRSIIFLPFIGCQEKIDLKGHPECVNKGQSESQAHRSANLIADALYAILNNDLFYVLFVLALAQMMFGLDCTE